MSGLSDECKAATWRRECERVWPAGLTPRGRWDAELAEEAVMRLVAVVRTLAGVACGRCGGEGQRTYASTAGWRGGVGGQSLTHGVCDGCWGTGRRDRTGLDRRRIEDAIGAAWLRASKGDLAEAIRLKTAALESAVHGRVEP